MKYLTTLSLLLSLYYHSYTQHSVARQWNETNLEAIRNDFARPTVHARNLFHLSIAMYECWAIYQDDAEQYMLGRDLHGFNFPLDTFPKPETPEDIKAAQEEAMSYAAYRLLFYRYRNSPGRFDILFGLNDIFSAMGYDADVRETTFQTGNPAHMGNYVADLIINYGLQDGSNENFFYENLHYRPVNPSLPIQTGGPTNLVDHNRWQPLSLAIFIDQSGNEIPGETPDFLSPEWGAVSPFAMTTDQVTEYERDGFTYKVYFDPGDPVYLTETGTDASSEAYKWGNSMVSVWQSHHDPNDGVIIDISPSAQGNFDISSFPESYEDFENFYDFFNGGDVSTGRDENPFTGEAYESNMVPRGDYGRVLAEFWADGPDSETPPGHWFTILNTVTDHPEFERKFEGEGEELDPLEYDVKAYLALGGAMHDCAIAAWGIKGWYDYIRPVSAIRGLGELGQSSDENAPNYNPRGFRLIEGYIEQVTEGDPLAGPDGEHIGKIKLYTWRGPDFITDPETDQAGVGWILCENWWPYQRPSFVTPPFAGYVSGHSTYSRAAAEVLTLLTGSEYFPGGIGEFYAEKDEFLVFEQGPSKDILLQWATYRDASDQTSLSRIWGGIHPPIDDIPGRLIGEQIGVQAFNKAKRYFNGTVVSTDEIVIDNTSSLNVFPNPVPRGISFNVEYDSEESSVQLQVIDISGKIVFSHEMSDFDLKSGKFVLPETLNSGTYVLSVKSGNKIATKKIAIH